VIVALDTQLAVGTATGVGVYARDLAAALRTAGVDTRELRAPWLNPWRFDRRVLWDQLLLPLAAAQSRATVLHATAGTMPLIRTLPTVVTVHDLAWHRVQSHTRGYARTYFGTLQSHAYRHAAAIVTDSEFSATEYRTLVDENATVHVIHPGVDPRFATLDRHPTEPPFALVVGTVERRKNLGILIEALPTIPDLRIVSVGPPTPYADELRQRATELNVAHRIDVRGYVDAATLDALYTTATMALIPSTYEGFGYALAEAMCAALPAIAANTSSLPELAAIAPDATIPLLPPHDPSAWSTTITELLHTRDAAQRRAVALRPHAILAFSWSTAAQAMRTIYTTASR
jgi:glycosyltransferase involved in cell wall biosynthesis